MIKKTGSFKLKRNPRKVSGNVFKDKKKPGSITVKPGQTITGKVVFKKKPH